MQCPVSCRSGTQLKIEPSFLGFLPRSTTQSFAWQKNHVPAKIAYRVTASAEYSRRRRRKPSAPRTKDSAPKGLTPRNQVPTSNRRRGQKNNEVKEGPGASSSEEFGSSSQKTAELGTGKDDKEVANITVTKLEEKTEDGSNGIALEGDSTGESSFEANIGQFDENGGIPRIDEIELEIEDAEEIPKQEVSSEAVESFMNMPWETFKDEEAGRYKNIETVDLQDRVTEIEENDASVRGRVAEEKRIYTKSNETETSNNIEEDKSREATTISQAGNNEIETPSENLVEVETITTVDDSSEIVKPEAIEEVYTSISEDKSHTDNFLKLKLGMEENMRKELLDRLAEENFKLRNKLFCYPEVVKPDQDVELFFNRSFSTLKNESNVFIMGAFNDWKWKSFTIKLSKSNLNGDWWSCQFHVPKEAYSIDFVFNNGEDVYENNDNKDFCITIEGGMDGFDFENFLLEEKRREQEEIARLEAEKEREAEEQRRIEAAKAAVEADRAQAREEVAKRKRMLQELTKKALRFVDKVWYIEPGEFKGEDTIRLYYNRSSGPLVHAKDIWIHGGYNNWKEGLSIISKLMRSESKGPDWWYAEVVVPDQALVLNWVFADGPPQQATIYDNNSRQDFHAIVPKSIPKEQDWVEEEQRVFRRLQEERRLREEAQRIKAEKTAVMKANTKERTLKTFLLSQKHIVYTDPLDVQAGRTVTIFYDPSNTVLNGKPEIWLRCSFNRWTHRLGSLPPQKMFPSENGSHLKANVKVPLDAYMMDFVFSEREDGGIFDNKNGMDYHIPVFGGVAKEPPMHIVHIAVEMAPIAKVGGLGDVVTSLSRAVQEMNHNVDIILPKYDCLNYDNELVSTCDRSMAEIEGSMMLESIMRQKLLNSVESICNVKDLKFHKSYFWGGTEIKAWLGKVEGLSVYFLEPQNGLFWAGCIYGRRNDGERFGFFCHAALEFLLQDGFHPDIIHCHDWSSAPVAWLFKEQYMHYGLSKARVVFTIHNLEFGADLIGKAMTYSDKATTVSPTYSQEVSGHPSIAPHLYKFHGILNGIDPDIWDPYNDKFIPISYTSENVIEGKGAAKEALQQRLGLKRADLPLVGIITRLTHQKGIHLIKHAIWRTLERGGQVVLLGSAPDPRIQSDFVNLANQLHSSYNDRARLCLAFDEPLSHLIYAGADFILVPSIFEPCGLTQLTAMRYGSIPVVRKTGGLYDTVFDADHDIERAEACGLEPNGFSFDGADAAGVDYALNRALTAWYDGREWFSSLCKRVMEQDWSWNRPALDYMELYHAARK